jgi:putative ABC transport system permease protein
MLKNYLTIAFRVLRRSKGYTLINVAGLSIGISCFLLIALYVSNELSYDSSYPDVSRLYRVEEAHWATTPVGIGPYLRRAYPDVEDVARFLTINRASVGTGPDMFLEKRVLFADSEAMRMFHFPLVAGDADRALAAPNSVVLTRSMASKYFGTSNPIGKMLRIETGRSYDCTVTGVVENTPPQTHLKFDFLVSFSSLQLPQNDDRVQWVQSLVYTYLLLKSPAHLEAMEHGLRAVLLQRFELPDTAALDVSFRPMTDVHLYSDCEKEIEPAGSIRSVFILSSIAILILVLALINFVNLAIARSLRRSKEVAMRKTLGAGRSQLITQFIGEAWVLSVLATIISMGLVELVLPSFNAVAGTKVSLFGAGMGLTPLWLLGLGVVIGVAAGGYPALFLSRFQPVAILRSTGTSLSGGSRSAFVRKALIVFQFCVTVVLIIGAVLIHRQLTFMHDRDLGLAAEEVVINPVSGITSERYTALRSELLANSQILSVSASHTVPGERIIIEGVSPQEATEREYALRVLIADADFPKTFGLKLQSGRFFSRDFISDTAGAFIVNERAAALFGWKDPIGKRIEFPALHRGGEVVGVVHDFNFASLHTEVEPLVIHDDENPVYFKYVSIRIGQGNKREAIEAIGRVWNRIFPGRPREYYFLDESFGRLYAAETTLGAVVTFFTVIGVLIACLGLFGLVALAAEQRTREIGIRKVLGGTVAGMVGLLTADFMKLVAIATVVAWPIAWYVMHRWLESFAYTIDIGWDVFVLAGGLALFIALGTSSVQALKAALTNPVDTLRSE